MTEAGERLIKAAKEARDMVSNFTPSKECLRMMEEALETIANFTPSIDDEVDDWAAGRNAGGRAAARIAKPALSLLASERQKAKPMMQQISELEASESPWESLAKVDKERITARFLQDGVVEHGPDGRTWTRTANPAWAPDYFYRPVAE